MDTVHTVDTVDTVDDTPPCTYVFLLLQVLEGHGGVSVNALSWNPLGGRHPIIASVGGDGTARLWDVATGNEMSPYLRVIDVAVKSRVVVAVTAKVKVEPSVARGGMEGKGHFGEGSFVTDIVGDMVDEDEPSSGATDAAVEDGGVRFGGGGGTGAGAGDLRGDEGGDAAIAADVVAGAAGATAVSWSKDGAFLLTGDAEGAVKLWEMSTRKVVLCIPRASNRAVTQVCFSGLGRNLGEEGGGGYGEGKEGKDCGLWGEGEEGKEGKEGKEGTEDKEGTEGKEGKSSSPSRKYSLWIYVCSSDNHFRIFRSDNGDKLAQRSGAPLGLGITGAGGDCDLLTFRNSRDQVMVARLSEEEQWKRPFGGGGPALGGASLDASLTQTWGDHGDSMGGGMNLGMTMGNSSMASDFGWDGTDVDAGRQRTGHITKQFGRVDLSKADPGTLVHEESGCVVGTMAAATYGGAPTTLVRLDEKRGFDLVAGAVRREVLGFDADGAKVDVEEGGQLARRSASLHSRVVI